jgi:hypothetical protein
MAKMYGQMFFDADGQGWSEGLYLLASDVPTAITAMGTIITGRLAFLGTTYNMVYARVSSLELQRDSYLVPGVPAPGVVASGTVNRVADCFLVRGQHPSPPGGHSNLYFHGVPDASIVNGSYFPSGNAAYDSGIAAYLVTLQSLTGWAPKHRLQSKVTSITAWLSLQLRDITSRKVGRPFGQSVGRRRRR